MDSNANSGADCPRREIPLPTPNPILPLHNLSLLSDRISSVRDSLSSSLHRHHSISDQHLRIASSEISSAIHNIILNAAALLSSSTLHRGNTIPTPPVPAPTDPPPPDPTAVGSDEIVEIDAAELLAEHVHFCEICGKGFKRDANLRMHMRAHGNKFKTLDSLTAKSDENRVLNSNPRSTYMVKFSCPFAGCNRNRNHRRFRPLKSVVCVKSHYKRSHCPKMYKCNNCGTKSFSVLGDLKSHQKSCGRKCKWRCSCGTSFSRKDKLFRHVSLFEGHTPEVEDDQWREKGKGLVIEDDGEDEEGDGIGLAHADVDGDADSDLFASLLDGFQSLDEEGFLDNIMNYYPAADFRRL